MERNPLKYPKITATINCNSRTKKGFCGNIAGYNTPHKGFGRCGLHDPSPNRILLPNNRIASQLKDISLKEHYEAIQNDPKYLLMQDEFISLKLIFEKMMHQIPEDPEEWLSDKNETLVSNLMKLSEQLGRTFARIHEANEKSKRMLGVNDVIKIVKKIADVMKATCPDCPNRNSISNKIMGIKIEDAKYEDIGSTLTK